MFWQIIIEIKKGRSLVRGLMNLEMKNFYLDGLVVDVGGGKLINYRQYINFGPQTKIEILDGSFMPLNFEMDQLPHDDQTVEGVIVCNVLEHIYNFRHLLKETHRILKPKGIFLGFVPFLMGYHPDPSDYFRYTNEALKKIFSEAQFQNIKIIPVGLGPFMVHFNNIMLYLPLLLRLLIFPPYYILDLIFVKISPSSKAKFCLGYVFFMQK